MAPEPDKALYVGEAGNYLSDGTPLISGETIALVPRAEAEASDYWEPVTKGKPTSPNPRNAAPDGTPPGSPTRSPGPGPAKAV